MMNQVSALPIVELTDIIFLIKPTLYTVQNMKGAEMEWVGEHTGHICGKISNIVNSVI